MMLQDYSSQATFVSKEINKNPIPYGPPIASARWKKRKGKMSFPQSLTATSFNILSWIEARQSHYSRFLQPSVFQLHFTMFLVSCQHNWRGGVVFRYNRRT